VPVKYTGSYGTNGFYIDGATSTFLGKDAKATSAAVTNKASTSSEWGGSTGAYTFATNEIDRSSTVNSIISTDLLSGDFSFDFTLTTSGGAVRVGVIDDQESNTFNGTGDDGGMDSMTNSWYLDKGNNQFRYGGASQGSAGGIVNGAAVTIERTGSTIKITDDGSDAHTFSQTFSGPVRVVISGGGAAFNLDNVQYTADGASGNDNSFFSSGLAAADQMLDTPTNNFCVWNILAPETGTAAYTFSDGNLFADITGFDCIVNSTFTFDITDSGGWYAEVTIGTGSYNAGNWLVGLNNNPSSRTTGSNVQNDTNLFFFLGNGSKKNGSGETTGVGAALSAGDTVMLLFKSGAFYAGKAGTGWADGSGGYSDSSPTTALFSSITGQCTLIACNTTGDDAEFRLNAGQSSFVATAPTGSKTLSAANLPDPTIADPSAHFQTSLWNGNGSTQTITQSGRLSTFEPGWIWSKARNAAQEHVIFDQVRGTTKYIQPDNSLVEGTQSGVTAFNSDGFDLGSWAVANGSGQTHVGWQWKANGSGSSNTDGSITSTVSANQTAGVSIVKYTGNATVGATVGHGLGAVPKMLVVKPLDAVEGWAVYHESLGNTKGMYWNLADSAYTGDYYWNDTTPSSTVFTLHDHPLNNGSGNSMIAYCFAEVEGFSTFGKYTGNGSADGPFIYTGFMPEFIMVKSSSNSGTNWDMLDATRETFNTRGNQLFANSSSAEASNDHECDFLSNGFKWRDGSGSNNGSGYTIIYMAFARSPFKTANAQ
jgi:hypothetical protein